MTDIPTDPRDAQFRLSEGGGSLGRQAGRASVFTLVMSALKTVQQIAGIAIVARLVPPAEYGIFAMAMPGVMLAMALATFGLPQAVIQKKHITHGEVTTLFWLNLAFALVAAGAVALLSWPAAAFYDEPRVTPVFQVIGLAVVLSALTGQYQAILRRTLRIRAVETIALLGELFGLAVAVAGALAGLSYWALVLQALAAPALQLVLMAFVTGWLPSGIRHIRIRAARGSLAFGGYLAGYSVLNKVSRFAGTVVVGGLLGAAPAGLFNRAQTLGMLPTRRVVVPLSGVFIPTLSRLQDDPDALREMFLRLMTRLNLILMPVAVLMAVGAEPLVALMLGPDWTGVVPLLILMSAMVLRTGTHGALQHLMIACGRSRELFIYSIIRLAVIAGALTIAAEGGVEAMMAAYVLADLLITLPILATFAHYRTPLRWSLVLRSGLPDLFLAVAVAGGLTVALVPALDGLPSLVRLVVLALAIGAIYALRVAVSRDLRADVRRALWKRLGKGPRAGA